MILAGDIGGTNTRLALFDRNPREPVQLEIFRSSDHAGLEEILDTFLNGSRRDVRAASFGVAGPVHEGRARGVNLRWPVDAASVASMLGLRRVGLVNDLEANARGIATLGPDDVVVLNEGDPRATGNMALVSAGTGLGEAGLIWDGDRHHPFASEGGHADFAPVGALQTSLRDYLATEHGHISVERVCSGAGLANIYRYLSGADRTPSEISDRALSGIDNTAALALHLMVVIYGAEAGNLALKFVATGGVWLGGGIAPKILPELEGGAFMRAFVEKGRFQSMLERIPVRVILDDKTALLGAASHAATHGGAR